MSQCNSSVADPVVVQSSYTDQRWDSNQAAQQLPDESSAALSTLQQDDKQLYCEGIFPADRAAVTCTTADLSDGDSATAKPADPGVADSASADMAEPARQAAAYPVQTSDAGGYVFMSRGDQKIPEASSEGPEADMASADVPQTTAEAAGLPSIRAIIHDAAASVAEASQAASNRHSASTAEEGKQGGGADAELGSRKHSMQPLNDMLQKLSASVPSSSSAGVAMQYPWMDPSDQQGSRDLTPQQGLGALAEEAPGVHVTFATNMLPSARHQGNKIPLRYLAAAAADKAPAASAASTKEEAWVVSSAPEQAGVALRPEAEQGQSQHRSLAEHSETAAIAGTLYSTGSTEGSKPLHWQQQQQQHRQNQGDGSMHGTSDNGEANEGADALSVASFANSAASGLGHLMRAQQPWSETESSSSPDRTSATGSADGKDISQLQAEVMNQTDTEQQLPQQPLVHVVSQLDGHQQSQQQLLSDPVVPAEADKEGLPSHQQPAQQDRYLRPVQVTATSSSSSRPSWALDQEAVHVQPMLGSSIRQSWALEQQALQHVHDSSGSRPISTLEQQSAHEQAVHASSSTTRPSWALEQSAQPVHESSSNGRPSWVHDEQAAYAPPVIDSGSRPSWAVNQLAGASQPWNHAVPVAEVTRDGTLVSQLQLTRVSQLVLVGGQGNLFVKAYSSAVCVCTSSCDHAALHVAMITTVMLLLVTQNSHL